MARKQRNPGRPTAQLRWRELGTGRGEGSNPPRCGPDASPGDLVAVCEALRSEACPWLLDSAGGPDRLGRYSFAGADPSVVIRARGPAVEVHVRRAALPGLSLGFHRTEGDPLEILGGWLPRVADRDIERTPPLPFLGGAVGYLGYEVGQWCEPVAMDDGDGLGFPDATLLLVDRLVAVDHHSNRTYLLGWGFGDDADEAESRALDSVAVASQWLERGVSQGRPVDPCTSDWARRCEMLSTALPENAQSSLDEHPYRALVSRWIEEIEAGNVYEANLTQRISLPFDGDAFGLYRALRRRSPAPFASFIELPEGAILSSSPERFLKLADDGRVESRPIKGTRPRGRTPEEDGLLRKGLETSEKDRAENLMIVDLVRNDLGRVCATGSIAVPELMAVEPYEGVFQLVSTVTGELRGDADRVDLLRATFPPGSMTGAPKVAAMRLIEKSEPIRRGVYSGALGYFDVRGGFDLSVVIRTLLLEKGRAHLHVGGAVVADSDPAAEWAECLAKARPLLAAWEASKP